MKRFAVHPGWVTSKNDGDRHYITAFQLMRLYDVVPSECISIYPESNLSAQDRMDAMKLIQLVPRYDGNYSLEEVMKRSIITYTPSDYPEDKDLENGCYWNRCACCKEGFIGHKGRSICKTCHDEAEFDFAELEANRPSLLWMGVKLIAHIIWILFLLFCVVFLLIEAMPKVTAEIIDQCTEAFNFLFVW